MRDADGSDVREAVATVILARPERVKWGGSGLRGWVCAVGFARSGLRGQVWC
jgi:hypothetical protein